MPAVQSSYAMIIAVKPMEIKINYQLKSQTPSRRLKEIIQSLLKQRGLNTLKQQTAFFNPPFPETLQPFSAALLTKVSHRIAAAKKNQELIYIYGDYDADGVSATTILWETLYSLGLNVMPYIPTREDKVRGLSQEGIDNIIALAKTKPDLIITVDNGITANKACRYAKKQGIDIIITDHHQSSKTLPTALAIIHSVDLAGAGVAWFLSLALSKLAALKSLDVAALGTIADMVPLLGINRSIAKYGLKQLSKTPRPGLKALADLANLDLPHIRDYQIGYTLAPRLNAMARLEHALDSVRLLCVKDALKAQNLAKTLEFTNQSRQDLTSQMLEDALTQVDTTKPLIFIKSSNYHEGIVGLVASGLAQKFKKPAIVIAQSATHSKASARSVIGFNIIKALREIEDLVISLGGHEQAAGFTTASKNLPIIEQKLQLLASAALKDKAAVKAIEVDCLISLKDITWELLKKINQFQPFGVDNPEPVFAVQKVPVSAFRPVGQEEKHLKLKIADLDAIAFNQGYLSQNLTVGELVDIIFTLDQNEWNGKKSLQLKVKSIILAN